MVKKNQGKQQGPVESKEIKNHLEETEETLRAIRQYMVDAFVVTRENGMQVVTLSEADFPYRRMVESMNEGAVTLIPDGTIFYCNPRFAQMVESDSDKLIGVRFQDLIPADQRPQFEAMLRDAGPKGLRGEFCIQHLKKDCRPVQLSFYQLRADDANGIAIIATDISERIEAEEKIRSLASELTIAEQEERHRISQVLHDDLQQRLFAIRAQLSYALDSFKGSSIPRDMQTSIDQVQNWLTEAITMTRNLSVDISPSVLHGEGLVEALNWLCVRMKEQHNLQIDIDANDDFEVLPDHMRVTLFRAVRELLFNVVKHAGVLRATIKMARINGHGQITIIDSGDGFDAQSVLADPQTAHGLLLIRNRLSLMGGTLTVESVRGHGTRATIDFPLSLSPTVK